MPAPAAAHEASRDLAFPSPARGMVYSGLSLAHAGPCADGYVVQDTVPGTACTHGPDPAPPGIDVTDPPSLRQLALSHPPRTHGVKCIGDGSSGPRVEAVYAHASDRPDEYASAAPIIETILGEMSEDVEESALETGGYRTIRWTTAGCSPVVRDVTLSPSGDDSLSATASELDAQGLDDPNRDYIVFADAEVYCGIGQFRGQYARVDTGCWGYAALHELFHNFGAVSLSAPNTSGGFHCTDESDVMCYSDEPNFPTMHQICPYSHERLLDCNHDDYFSTAAVVGTFLSSNPFSNSADSPFLADVDGEPATWLPETFYPYYGAEYVVRAFNADDDECVYGEGPASGRWVRFFCVGFRGDRTADVTGALLSVAGGSAHARLKLVATDRGSDDAFGFVVTKDGWEVLRESGGQAGSLTAGLPGFGVDPVTGWPVFYEKQLDVDLSPLVGPESAACRQAKKVEAAARRSARRARHRASRVRRSLPYSWGTAPPHRLRQYRRLVSRLRSLSQRDRELQYQVRRTCRS